MQPDSDTMRANLSPLTRLPAGAKIFNVDLAIDYHRPAKRNFSHLDHASQQWGRPVRTDHLPLLKVGARHFHDVPTRCFAQ